MPNPHPMPSPSVVKPAVPPCPKSASWKTLWNLSISWQWGLLIFGGFILVLMMSCLAIGGLFAVILGSDKILPGVEAGGVDLGGKTQTEAVVALDSQWETLILKDGDRVWEVNAAEFGIVLDSTATAQAAYDQGRSVDSGFGTLSALFGTATTQPVFVIDLAQVQNALTVYASQLEQQPVNAGVRLVDGQAQATPALDGRLLDIDGTLAALQLDAATILEDRTLELQMYTIPAAITDASPMVAQASQLLINPLYISGYDPIKNERYDWALSPQDWGHWLVATTDTTSPIGLNLALNEAELAVYLQQKEATLGGERYLKINESIIEIQKAIAAHNMSPWVRVYYRSRQHTVGYNETFSSIAYDYGIPYPWIQQANPGVPDALSVGQVINIPSQDDMLPRPVIPNKRIVVSISQQRMWAYENGQVKWEWAVSTGIASSPTAPGIFQIQSHEPNAYAGNWNLWMPYFMGVYRPVPTSEFMNGFHGFPTRGGSQLLWTNNLGSPVTYGCILVSNTNAELLYSWAEEGVVVEIQR